MGVPGHPPGDLYVSVKVRTGRDFWREGQDMHTTRPVSMRHAILGGPIHIEGPDGRVCEVAVPPGTQPGDIVKVPGGGVTGALGGAQGDLVVHVAVQLPKTLSARARKLLEELSEELTRGVPKGL
jgi:molecular chaperone DnaJ